MILKDIYLYPDLGKYPDEIVHPFRDQTRSICNYLARAIKPLRFATDGFKRICFVGVSNPNSECQVNRSGVLVGEIPFEAAEYLGLKTEELNQYFKRLLEIGIRKCALQHQLPEEFLLASLQEFENIGFVNRWQIKTKKIRESGLKCTLIGELTTEEFQLTLAVSKGTKTLFEKVVITTPPDEIVFVPKVNDVRQADQQIIVVDKFGDPSFKLDLNQLSL